MTPEPRELFTILVIRGSRSERHSLVREVGMGSNMQVLVGDSTMFTNLLFCDRLEKTEFRTIIGRECCWFRRVSVKVLSDVLDFLREKHAKSVLECRTWYVRREWCGL